MAKHKRSGTGRCFRNAADVEIADCDAIFPIFRCEPNKLILVGTGFYISVQGIFVTLGTALSAMVVSTHVARS